jgi:CheY-like chemotaxis protein
MSDVSHIVIVAGPDGNPVETFGQHFNDLGCDVYRPKSSSETCELAKETAARLVILDLDKRLRAEGERPETDACRTCAALRSLPAYQTVPIIIVTGADNQRVRATAERAGATALLVKPLSIWDLMRELERLGIRDYRMPRRNLPGPENGAPWEMYEARTQDWTSRSSRDQSAGQPSKLDKGPRMLATLRRLKQTDQR